MKNRQSLRTSTRAGYLAITLVVAGISPSAFAAISTWTGTTNGTWDTTTAANWGGTAFTSSNDALFTGTPTNNVTTATGLTIGAITLDNTFTGSVALTGNNTVSGATTISGGTLSLVTATGLGTSAVTVNSGGTLALNASTSADITYANTVAGAGKVQFLYSATGSHDIFLNNLGSFTGTIELSLGSGQASTGGKARLGTGTTLSGTSSLIIDSGTQLYMGAGNVTFANIQVSGTGNTENRGAIRSQSGTLTGAISLMGNTTIGTEGGAIAGSISSGASGTQTLTLGTTNSTGNLTLSSNIGGGTGTIALTKTQNGTTTLSGTNTYSGGTTITGGTLSAGSNSALGTGTVAFNGGTLANSTNVTLANDLSTTSAVANLNASGGTMVLNGNITGANSVNLTPTNKITLAGTNSFATTSANSYANLNVNAGAGGLDITGSTTTGVNNSTSSNFNGYLNVAGTVTVTVQSGGSLAVYGSSGIPGSIVGQNTAGTSTLVVNGGSLMIGGHTAFSLGNNVNTATGILTISSGTATITAGSATLQDTQNFVALGRDNATGIINLDGGTLATGRQFVRDGSSGGTAGSGSATFNFNGGTLQAQANQTSGNGWFETATSGNFQVVTTTVKAGGAKIDTNGYTTNINTVLAHDSGLGGTADGGLTKSGSGTLSLGAANTYTGTTTVSAGTLALGLNGTISNTLVLGTASPTVGALDVTTKSAFSEANVSGNGTINIGSGKTVTVTGALAPGFSPGTLNVTGDLALTSSTSTTMEIAGNGGVSGTDSDYVNVTGAMTLNGLLAIVSYGGYDLTQPASYNLFDSTSVTGDFTGVSVGGNALSLASNVWSGTYGDTTYSFSETTGVLTVVPEPGAALLGGLGMLTLLRRRRH